MTRLASLGGTAALGAGLAVLFAAHGARLAGLLLILAGCLAIFTASAPKWWRDNRPRPNQKEDPK